MAGNITFDTSDFDRKVKNLEPKTVDQSKRALYKISQEIGRLGSFEVPHDTGMLQNSYGIDPEDEGYIVGYNKVYAAYQHEGHWDNGSHVIKFYQKGRKGKYLEDPIKNNLDVFLRFYQEIMGEIF